MAKRVRARAKAKARALTIEEKLELARVELEALVIQKDALKQMREQVDARALAVREVMERAGLKELLGDGVRGLIYETSSTRIDYDLAERLLTKNQYDMIFVTSRGTGFRVSRV